jgi:hypothetical protein
VVPPRYFESDQCRTELIQFTTKAKNLGLDELLLPLLSIDVPEIHEADPADDAVRLIKETQWVDWRHLRLEDLGSSDARKGVNGMATRLGEISKRVAAVPDEVAQTTDTPRDEADAPGAVDLLARGEEALPQMGTAMETLTDEMNEISALMDAGLDRLNASDARGAGFAGRLQVAREMAKDLDPHAEVIQDAGRDYAAALLHADQAVRTLLGSILDGTYSGNEAPTPEARQEALDFVLGVLELTRSAEEGMAGLRGFLSGLESIGEMSRDIRRPASKIKNGLQGMVDGHALLQEWGEMATLAEKRLEEDQEDPGKQDEEGDGDD